MRKKTQYIVVNEIYKTIYCGYPQKRAWKNLTTAEGGALDMVNAGHNYIGDVVDSDLKKLVEAGTLSATTDFSFVRDVDFIAICVPTPLDKHQEPDISYVKSSAEAVAKYLTKDTMVVLESTYSLKRCTSPVRTTTCRYPADPMGR